MPSTKDAGVKKGLFGLFKGRPNTGKSVGALSFPGAFVFDFDRKMPTVAQKHFPDREFNWEPFPDVFELSKFIKPWLAAENDMNYKPCPYETLIVDSVTSLSTLVLTSLDKTKGTNIVEMMGHVTTSAKGAKSVEVMGIDYYNSESNFFERYFMSAMKILWQRPGNPKHVIVIAHEMIVESAPDLATGAVRVTNSILTAGRKAAVFIPSRFDDEYLFYSKLPELGKEGPVRRMVRLHNKDDARCSYKFPETVDFTDKHLYDQLNTVAKWDSIGADVSVPSNVSVITKK